jgi:transcriptional regulator with XRE-family HTH domain
VKKLTPLGMRIKNAIKKNKKEGLGVRTQQELAKKIGCSNGHLSAVITGEAIPSMGLLGKLASELNTSVSELLKEV